MLLTHEAFRRLSGKEPNLIEMLAQKAPDDIDFNPSRLEFVFRVANLD